MANRPYLLDVNKIAAAKDGVHKDGGELDGCALEIHIRNGGKSKRAYFRYNGTPFGEKRTERIPLGSYDQGFAYLRRERAACERLVEQGKSPRRHRSEQTEQRQSASRTLRQAIEEYFAWAGGDAEHEPALWNSPWTRKLNNQVKRRHFDNAAIMDLPVQSIRPHHLNALIGPYWRKKPGTPNALGRGNGIRMRSLLHSTFEREIDNEYYAGRNPASWRKTAPLTGLLGPEPRSTPHAAALYTDIPRIIAHLRSVRQCVPGYLTIAEAAYAYDRDGDGIRHAADSGKFPGAVMRPMHTWNKLCRFIPIAELKQVYGEFKREPIAIERADVVTNCEMLQAVIFTAVRPSMICNMYWGQIKEKERYIEYLPARDGRPSEHKNGWKYDFPYLVMLTDNLRAIIEIQRQQQIRDGVEINPHGPVFRHARTRCGVDYWFNQGISHRTISDYLRNAAARLDIEKKSITPAGMRATFGHWAKDEHGYSDELINMTLGHINPAIRENSSNRSYLYSVQRRRDRHEMMARWEAFCLGGTSQRAANVVIFPASA
jgi:integrase